MPSDPSQREGRPTPGRSVEIPEPIRAAAGLAAMMLDQARQLPAAITGLPVRVAGVAMQTSLRLQQRYAGLVVKGDELLTQISRPEKADPPWATFDDDVVGVADAVTEDIGMDVTAADGTSTYPTSDVALPPIPGTTQARPQRKSPTVGRLGHEPSAFDLVEDVSAPSGVAPDALDTVGTMASNGHEPASALPVPGYDAFTLAQLRARLRTFDSATLISLLSYERAQRARSPYLTMLENRLNRSSGQS